MALALNRSNVLLDGISSWKIQDITRPDIAYYSLPFPRASKFTIASLGTPDSIGRPTAYGSYKLDASIITPAVKTTAEFIKLLDAMGTQKLDHKITLNGGQIFSSSLAAEPGLGVKWQLLSDKDMDDDMHILFEATRILTQVEYNACLVSGSAPVDGTPNVGDTFYGMRLLARSDIIPAGIAKIECGVGGYTDDLGVISQGKFKAELLTEMDTRQRPLGVGVKIDFEALALQTTEAELLQWDDIAQRQNDVKITFANGIVCTMAAMLGVLFDFMVEKDATGSQRLKVTGSGVITKSAWDAIWS